MGYFVNYIVTSKPQGIDPRLGHATIAITRFDPANPAFAKPKTLFRTGFFRKDQVLLEDDIYRYDDEARTYFHKTYPISVAEMGDLVAAINKSRQLEPINEYKELKEEPLTRGARGDYVSRPNGPQFNNFTNNCKSYALSMLKVAGINDPSLKNWIFDIPVLSGKLHKVVWTHDNRDTGILVWTKPMQIADRNDYSRFTEAEIAQLNLEKTFSNISAKIESYLDELAAEIKQVLLKNAWQDPHTYLAEVLVKPEQQNTFSASTKLLIQKYSYALELKKILNGNASIEQRLAVAQAYQDQDQIKSVVETNRGFWSPLRNTLRLKSKSSQLRFFIDNSCKKVVLLNLNLQI